MEREEFYAALCRTENDLEHSAKGTTWSKKNHKYLKKIGDTYIYAQDQVKNFVDTKITGKAYKDEWKENEEKTKKAYSDRNIAGQNGDVATAGRAARVGASYGAKWSVAQKKYYTKSLKGIAESIIEKGNDWLTKLVNNLTTSKKDKGKEMTKQAIRTYNYQQEQKERAEEADRKSRELAQDRNLKKSKGKSTSHS